MPSRHQELPVSKQKFFHIRWAQIGSVRVQVSIEGGIGFEGLRSEGREVGLRADLVTEHLGHPSRRYHPGLVGLVDINPPAISLVPFAAASLPLAALGFFLFLEPDRLLRRKGVGIPQASVRITSKEESHVGVHSFHVG